MSEGASGGGGILREIAAFFSIEVESEGAEHAHGVINELIEKLHEFGEVLLGGALVEGMREFVHEQAEAGEVIANNAQILGLSTEAFQTWRYAAAQSAVSADQFNASMAIFQRNSQGAVSGNHEAARAFHSLGVNVRDAQGHVRSLDELLPEVSNGFASIHDPAERTATAVRLFGRSGAQLVAFLSTGAHGLAAMRAEVEELGGGATEQMIENSEELIHQQRRLDLSLFSLRSRIANSLLPMFTRFTEMGVQATVAFNHLVNTSHLLQIAIVALQGALTVLAVQAVAAFFAPLATAALFAVALGVIILAVDEVVTTLEGGHSVIRAFVDELFGIGTTAKIVDNALKNIRQTIEGLTNGTLFTDLTREMRDLDVHQALVDVGLANEAPTAEQQQARQTAIQGSVAASLGASPGGPVHGAPTAGQRAARDASVPVALGQALSARSVDVPTGGGRSEASVHIESPITITVPQGTDAAQVAAIRRVVVDVTSEQHRQVAAALGREAPYEGG